MAVIKVPKTPRKAFNPDRIASGLIQAQIQHLAAAAGVSPASRARRAKLRTERESAAYIERLTRRIYEQAGADRGPEIAVAQPPSPIAGTPTTTSTTRQGSPRSVPSARAASAGGILRPAPGAKKRSTAARRKPGTAKRTTPPKGRRRSRS